MHRLKQIFEDHDERGSGKWAHYVDIYEKHFEDYVGKEVHILEIGISGGGSLQIWKKFFGPNAKIYGVDTAIECKKFEEDQIKVFIGDQSNKKFLNSIITKIPKLDIILDDGGHMAKQQINSFEILFPFLDVNGVYMVEDTHTSYMKKIYKGSFNAKNTFISHMKKHIDYLHAWHSDDSRLRVNDFSTSVESMTFYNSIVVINKKPISQPVQISTGVTWLPKNPNLGIYERIKNRIKMMLGNEL